LATPTPSPPTLTLYADTDASANPSPTRPFLNANTYAEPNTSANPYASRRHRQASPPSGGTAGNVDCSVGGNPVDAVDALKILRWVAGLTVSQNEQCTNPGDAMTSGGNPYIQGDVDCSGAVTAVDALKILRWLAGLPISLGVPPAGNAGLTTPVRCNGDSGARLFS
jgi:hypothetical protein